MVQNLRVFLIKYCADMLNPRGAIATKTILFEQLIIAIYFPHRALNPVLAVCHSRVNIFFFTNIERKGAGHR